MIFRINLRDSGIFPDNKIHLIEKLYNESQGSPVFTIEGKYSTRGWTEWTQGFQYGSALLQYDATGDEKILRECKEEDTG